MVMEYIPIRKAAELLMVSESTVRRLFDSGRLRGHLTPGGHRRILQESLEQLQAELQPGITFP